MEWSIYTCHAERKKQQNKMERRICARHAERKNRQDII